MMQHFAVAIRRGIAIRGMAMFRKIKLQSYDARRDEETENKGKHKLDNMLDNILH